MDSQGGTDSTGVHFTQIHCTLQSQFCIGFDNILSYLKENNPR